MSFAHRVTRIHLPGDQMPRARCVIREGDWQSCMGLRECWLATKSALDCMRSLTPFALQAVGKGQLHSVSAVPERMSRISPHRLLARRTLSSAP